MEKNKKLLPTQVIVVFCLALFNLFVLERGNTNFILPLFFFILLLALFSSKTTVIILISCIIPVQLLFKIPNSYTVVPFLMLIYIIKSFLFSNSRIIRKGNSLILFVLLFLVSLMASLINQIDVMSTLPFFIHLFFVLRIVETESGENKDWLVSVAMAFVASTVICCLGSIMFPAAQKLVAEVSEFSSMNPGLSSVWTFARSLVTSIAFIVVFLLERKNKRFLDWVFGLGFIILFLYFIIQSGRFTSLIGLLVIILCLPFTFNSEISIKKKVGYFVTTLIIVAVVIFILYFNVYKQMIVLRGDMTDNGRYLIWQHYLEILSSDIRILFFGVGAGSISSFASKMNMVTAHNIVIEKMIELGIVGILILLGFLFNLGSGKKLLPSYNKWSIPFLAFIGTSLTQGTSGDEIITLLLAICLVESMQNSYDFNNRGILH